MFRACGVGLEKSYDSAKSEFLVEIPLHYNSMEMHVALPLL